MNEAGQNRARILVVDDEDLNRALLEAILVPEGYDVLHAEDGERALAVASAEDVDLVLLDVMMPRMDGIEACKAVRANPSLSTLPVVLLTALHDRSSRIRAKEAGADEFLTKPVDELELLVRVRSLLLVKAYHDLQRRQREVLEEELERIKAQLLRVDRLATLGTLAAGVGHELANIAAVLQGSLYFVEDAVREGRTPADEDLHELKRVGEHISTHARQLLRLGRPQAEAVQRVDLREVVSSTLRMLHTAGRTRRVDVTTDLPEGALMVSLNPTRIEQILVNLVGNAVDATEDREGRRTIRVHVERGPEGRALCCVEDNGVGIDASVIERIFDPYYTTKAEGHGTGLGLPVVRQIVAALGGRIWVNSAPGTGSAFWFDVPAEPASP